MNSSQQCSLPTIKIKISVDEQNTGVYQQKKYVIGIIPDLQRQISDVLRRICILLELDDKPEEMKILDDGFILPSKMGTCYLKDNVVYEVVRQKIQTKMLQEQQSFSQSQKQESEKVIKHAKKSKNKIKQPINSPSEDSSSQSQSQIPQIVKKPAMKAKKRAIQQSSQSEQSQSSDSSLMDLLASKKQRKQQKKQIKSISRDGQRPQQPIIEKKFTPKTKQSKYAEKNIPIKRLPQKIVSQSSDSSSSEPIAERVKRSVNQNKALEQNRKEEEVNIPARPKKVPIAVRKKPCATENTKNSEEAPKKGFQKFSEYLQEKWTPITKQLLQGWGATHKEQCILSEKNRIRFKVIELDMEKFVPKTSGWIEGFVEIVQEEAGEWKIKLVNVTKQIEGGAPEKQAFMEIGLINMQQVQIHKDTFTSQQSEYFKPHEAPHPEQSHPQIEQKQAKISEKEVPKNTDSIQQMVCGQIHYYFSQKNYTKDLFMKMHANKNPRKFIPLRVMLNFPKIKKLSINQDTLLDYLSTDPRKNTRHYELDEQNKLIRCKKYEQYHRKDYENKQEGDIDHNIEQ